MNFSWIFNWIRNIPIACNSNEVLVQKEVMTRDDGTVKNSCDIITETYKVNDQESQDVDDKEKVKQTQPQLISKHGRNIQHSGDKRKSKKRSKGANKTTQDSDKRCKDNDENNTQNLGATRKSKKRKRGANTTQDSDHVDESVKRSKLTSSKDDNNSTHDSSATLKSREHLSLFHDSEIDKRCKLKNPQSTSNDSNKNKMQDLGAAHKSKKRSKDAKTIQDLDHIKSDKKDNVLLMESSLQTKHTQVCTRDRFILWVKEDCKYCKQSIDLIKQLGLAHTERIEGLGHYMNSKYFKTLLANWNINDRLNTPFRSKYPVIIHENTSTNVTRFIGGFDELKALLLQRA